MEHVYVSLDPNEYHVLHPRPAYLIVTSDREGRLNVMAASWVMPVNDEPFILSLALDKETKTYQNLLEVGEFTVNVMGEEHAGLVYQAGSLSGKSVDKWKLLRLEPAPSKFVKPPGVKGSYGFVECRVERMVDVESVALVLARSLAVHVRQDLYEKYSWNLGRARILMHMRRRVFVGPGKVTVVPKT
ncbi:flavin reductase family protein [Thermogladius calderae]|uniref:flavin reductase family protein n=1 Tax=Thermogladius calderae TaxID=1200300 RepID=UPI001EE637D4|nr:flavin reductase family protein [Thermogladius calderae]